MIRAYKKRGETPLQAVERLRQDKKKLSKEKMSYIGRLDPMAEGVFLILVGDKENKERSKYLNFDKEYEATFLIGASTDSGDILGFVSGDQNKRYKTDINKIKKAVNDLKKIKFQTYPWFSGKTINGKKMFNIYKEGDFHGIKRPKIKVKIHKISDIKIFNLSQKRLKNDIFKMIPMVSGEFRQKETLEKWKIFLSNSEKKDFQVLSFRIKVSSGTFIRGFAEKLGKILKAPILLYKLKRTKIFFE